MNVFNRLNKTSEERRAERDEYWKMKQDYWRKINKLKNLFFNK